MNRPPPRTVSNPAALILVILLGLAAFGRVGKFEFTTWDDDESIVHNPRLNPVTPASWIFIWTHPQRGLYIPVTYSAWAFAADAPKADAAQLTQPQPADPATNLDARTFHTLNLVFHLLAAWLVFLTLRELIGADIPSLAGALLFLLHPVQVEAVAWVTGLKDVLSGLLALLAIWQYLRLARAEVSGQTTPPAQWRRRYLIASVALLLAMLAKQTALVVPAIVILLDRMILRRSWRTALTWSWPWLVLATPFAFVALSARSTQTPAIAPWNTPLLMRPLVAADALAFYLYKLVWPASLAFDYGRTPQRVVTQGWRGLTWVAPLLALVLAILLRKRARPVVAGALVALVILLPVLGLISFPFQAYSTVADHYLYLALLGPALAFAGILYRWQTNLTIAIAAAVLIALAARSFAQTSSWHHSEALFEHAREVNPSSFASCNGLAVAAADAHQYADAAAYATVAIQINPAYFPAYLTRAGALAELGNPEAAIADCRQGLELSHDHPGALASLAALLGRQHHFAEALPFALRAVEKSPDSLAAHLILANVQIAVGDENAARRELDWVLQRDPENVSAHTLLAQLGNPAPPATHPFP